MKKRATLTTIEDYPLDTRLFAQIIEHHSHQVETVSRNVQGPLDGSSDAVCSPGVDQQELTGLRLVSVLKKPGDLRPGYLDR